MTTEEPALTKLIVMVLRSNMLRIEGAAAINGESTTDAINRAFGFYEIISTAAPNTLITYTDVKGVEHRLVVLGPKAIRQRQPFWLWLLLAAFTLLAGILSLAWVWNGGPWARLGVLVMLTAGFAFGFFRAGGFR